MSDFEVVEEGWEVVVIEEVALSLEVMFDLNKLDEMFEEVSQLVLGEVDELGNEVNEVDEDAGEKFEEAIAADSAGKWLKALNYFFGVRYQFA